VKNREGLVRCPSNLANENSPLVSFCLFENGVMAYRSTLPTGVSLESSATSNINTSESNVVTLHEGNFVKYLGQDRLQTLLNHVMRTFAEMTLPAKTGHFVELRTSNLNISPIGRQCSIPQRDEFAVVDKKFCIREKLVKEFTEKFAEYKIQFAAGGQISIDVFPIGWDKSFPLRFMKQGDRYEYARIAFFGDRCVPGGNDYEMFLHPDVCGHAVDGPTDTLKQLKEFLGDIGVTIPEF